MLKQATQNTGQFDTMKGLESVQSSFNLAALEHLKQDLKSQIQSQNNTSSNDAASSSKVDNNVNKVEDNMSLSEIIAERYKSNIQVNKLKSPEEAAQVLIKDTKSFDVND